MQSIEKLREITHTAAIENKKLGIIHLNWINDIEHESELLVLWDMVQHINTNNSVIDVFAYNMLYRRMQRKYPLFSHFGKTMVVKYDHNNKEGLKHHFKDAFWNILPDNCNGIERQPHAFHYTFCDVLLQGDGPGVTTFEFEDVLNHFDVYIAEASRCYELAPATRQEDFGVYDGTKLGALVICKENLCIYTYERRVFSGFHLINRREVIQEKKYNKWVAQNARLL